MGNIDKFSKVAGELEKFIRTRNYRGYDPYDIMLSKYPLKEFGHKTLFVLSQLNKLSPINFRSIIGIPQGEVPKGLGLLLKAYSLYFKLTSDKQLLKNIEELTDKVINLSCKGFSGYCWGINYTYISRNGIEPAHTPSSVVSSIIHDGLFEYYSISSDLYIKDILISCANFVLNDLYITENEYGICFSYTNLKRDLCLNANGFAAEILFKTFLITQDNTYLKYAQRAIYYIIQQQNDDGSWDYSISNDGTRKKQIDFHQGFILKTLIEYLRLIEADKSITSSYKKGFDFYIHKQFASNGRALGRYPKFWPTDIHSQAQGIITCTLASYLDETYLKVADRILDWSIDNMFNNGLHYFHYKKYRYFSNKIEYMRWGQAWMLLAIFTFLSRLRHDTL